MTGTTFRINGDATRAEFLSGWAAIVQFLARKCAREPDYRLIKEPVKLGVCTRVSLIWAIAPCFASGSLKSPAGSQTDSELTPKPATAATRASRLAGRS